MSAGASIRRPPSSRAWAAVLPVLLAGAVVLALVIALTEVDPAPTGTVARIADDPTAFDGQEMVLRGTVADPPIALPSGAGDAFVLAGPTGERLLVLPTRSTDGLARNALVEVRGTVQAPEPAADERRPERPPLTRTDLLGHAEARAVVEADRVSPVEGGDT